MIANVFFVFLFEKKLYLGIIRLINLAPKQLEISQKTH